LGGDDQCNIQFHTFGYYSWDYEEEAIYTRYPVYAGVETPTNARIFFVSEKLHS